ncbi:MAG: hypothetical protein ACFFDS_01845 [Candidatus Thorarchaeota archaeon]
MVTENYANKNSKIHNLSLFPKEILYKIVLGKVKKFSEYFIVDKDLLKIRLIGNAMLVGFGILFCIFYLLTKQSVVLSFVISFVSCIAFFFVSGEYIRSSILARQKKFDEAAFLVLNSLSINMIATGSFPKSIELLNTVGSHSRYYKRYFEKIIYELNTGYNEDKVIYNSSKIFLNKKYQYSFHNIRNEEIFIDSDPDFLLRVKREIKLIEDNVVIFIAVSCLFPLVLSLVLALILPQNSLSLIIFPLMYALFGTFTLRFIQNRSIGDFVE